MPLGSSGARSGVGAALPGGSSDSPSRAAGSSGRRRGVASCGGQSAGFTFSFISLSLEMVDRDPVQEAFPSLRRWVILPMHPRPSRGTFPRR